jgi:hypothetical protein
MLIVTKTLSYFCNNHVFDSIYNHNFDNGPFSNHIILLIKFIINSYFDIKTHYLCRKKNETDSLRTWYNKITLFEDSKFLFETYTFLNIIISFFYLDYVMNYDYTKK